MLYSTELFRCCSAFTSWWMLMHFFANAFYTLRLCRTRCITLSLHCLHIMYTYFQLFLYTILWLFNVLFIIIFIVKVKKCEINIWFSLSIASCICIEVFNGSGARTQRTPLCRVADHWGRNINIIGQEFVCMLYMRNTILCGKLAHVEGDINMTKTTIHVYRTSI